MKTVTANTLYVWLETGEAVLVDVREPAEHAAQHIAAATLLPLAQVNASAMPAVAGKKVVMQCKGGGRSARACALLAEQDPSLDLYNLEGGITAWAAAGLPTRGTL